MMTKWDMLLVQIDLARNDTENTSIRFDMDEEHFLLCLIRLTNSRTKKLTTQL